MTAEIDLVPADQRRRNRVTGILLGIFVVTVITAFMVAFTRHGLPKDPEVWKRLEREKSADDAVPSSGNPIGAATQPSSVTPDASKPVEPAPLAEPVPQESQR
jgi:hypothetical protein